MNCGWIVWVWWLRACECSWALWKLSSCCRGRARPPHLYSKEGLRITRLKERKRRKRRNCEEGSGYNHRVTAHLASISYVPCAWNSDSGGLVISLHVVGVVGASYSRTTWERLVFSCNIVVWSSSSRHGVQCQLGGTVLFIRRFPYYWSWDGRGTPMSWRGDRCLLPTTQT